MSGNQSSDGDADHPSAQQDEHGTGPADQPTVSVPSPGRQEPAWRRTGAWPTAGRHFGPYQIMRRLGAGGMGEVYEAEHTESGHRVALKVLRHSLGSANDQKRFLREGRLAASVSHPHSVYVYGTEEIEGIPVISMEIVAGGTLADRVKKHGPLPVTEAVDAILQVISGLEAAEAVGVLHRDIKPANCFVDSDGAVKIGDYGLSTPTETRQETLLTIPGSFLGTPTYASPEQLQGEKLDVRSDIYSVGATLYHLLTGRAPFEAEGAVRVVAKIMKEVPEPPTVARPEIPKGLSRAVLRCLDKQPSRRVHNYVELERELVPFSSTALTPAGLGLRFLAGAIDNFIWIPPSIIFTFLYFDFAALSDPGLYQSTAFRLFVVISLVARLIYFAVPEGIWGASLGKAVCRLRVVGPERSVAGVRKALLRASVFAIVPALPFMGAFVSDTIAALSTRGDWATIAFSYLNWALLLILFARARRRNGYCGLHELVSNTRVILKSAYRARPVVQSAGEATPTTVAQRHIGPYAVVASLRKSDCEELLLGHDAILRRRVWIQVLPAAAPPVSAPRRDIGRAGRLRWLNGKRSAQECWDAYEAPEGTPLLTMLSESQRWSSVRYWLLDLAEEIAAGLENQSVPSAFGLDRVWITSDGRAKLLDFPAPGVDEESRGRQPPVLSVENMASGQAFLNQFAVATLEGRIIDPDETRRRTPAVPLPLRTRDFLKTLSEQAFETSEQLISNLKSLITQAAVVSRWNRLGHIASCGFVPIVIPAFIFLIMFLVGRPYPDAKALQICLERLEKLQTQPSPLDANAVRPQRPLEVYVAGRFRGMISDASFWSSPLGGALMSPSQRQIAERVLARHPDLPETQVAKAAIELRPFLDDVQRRAERGFSGFNALTMGMFLFGCVSILGLFSALVFRGGLLLQLFRIAVVSKDGARASRPRTFWRSCPPCLLVMPIPFFTERPESIFDPQCLGGLLLFSLFVVGAVRSVANPERGFQDRIAGTYLVPR